MRMQLGEDIIRKNPEMMYQIPYAHWIIKDEAGDKVKSDENLGKSRCPTLQRCLGYQACLFNYGNEFCLMDPAPGQRKVCKPILKMYSLPKKFVTNIIY